MNSSRHKPDFLVVGLQRSGTHWVTALLNAHPEIACFPALPFRSENPEYDMKRVGEVHLFNTIASLEPGVDKSLTRPLDNFLTQVHGIFADLAPLAEKLPREEVYARFIERYEELCEKMRYGKRFVGESSPMYVFHLDFIDRFYPGIKKICILRDPKDKIVSWHFNLIRKERKSEAEKITDEFIKEYLEHTIKKELSTLLAYEGNIHCLTYEWLHDNTAGQVEKLLAYLEAESNSALIDEIIRQASFEHLTKVDSAGRARRPGEQSIRSHYRKGVVGDWVNYLTVGQGAMVDRESRELFEKVLEKYVK